MLSLHHISIKTSNLDILVEFYNTYFCNSVVHQFMSADGDCYGYMLRFAGGGVIEILRSNVFEQINKERANGLHHFCLQTDHLDDFLLKIPISNIARPVKIGKTDRIKQVMISDPDGNLIEVHERIKDC